MRRKNYGEIRKKDMHCYVFLTLLGRVPLVNAEDQNSTAPYRWVKVTENAAFAPRNGAGALVYKGKMWLLGDGTRIQKKKPTFRAPATMSSGVQKMAFIGTEYDKVSNVRLLD
jgi:hypothetical protein